MMQLVINLNDPAFDGTTLGDYDAVKGAMYNSATGYIDWEKLNAGAPDAIDTPGRIILAIAAQLPGTTA